MCPHWGVLAVGAKGPGLDQGMLSGARHFYGKLAHKGLPCEISMCISTAHARAKCLARAVLVFWAMSMSCGRRRTSGTFWGLKRCLRDRCRTPDTFSSVWRAWHFLDVAKTLAGVGQNEVVLEVILSFAELGQRFERVELRDLWKCRHFWF